MEKSTAPVRTDADGIITSRIDLACGLSGQMFLSGQGTSIPTHRKAVRNNIIDIFNLLLIPLCKY